jgi:general secretion pathway protein M
MNFFKLKLQTMVLDLQITWQQRTLRERQLVSAAAVLLMLALTWSVAIAPALRIWREAPVRQAALDAQTSQMQQLQAQAQSLKKPSSVTRAEAIRWLEANIPTSLGKDTKWSLQDEQLSVILSGTSADQLAGWLGQAREQAQALPLRAQLQQTALAADGSKTPADGDRTVRWSGSLLLSLP